MNGSNLVLVKGQRFHLHPRQFAVAFTFFCNLEQAVSQEFLLSSYWRSSRASDPSRALATCVSQIRTRLSLDRENEFKLLRLSGRNYKLTAQPLSWC
ncbi:winged helix-turn-helix domain-containing protein [Variovorax paradoxus]|uniref:winged helix-turn-helix domain-containing protein n=1 Tax=Variovorax paradoxus TaxID=34073 RepID=UPI0012FAEB7B|nr:winged helix-turn-helix domain-containing protein [Variovorax paradoxus]